MMKTKILRYFALNLDKQKTIRKVSQETETPYMTANRIVKDLADKNILTMSKLGNSIVCNLNLKNMLTKNYLILAEDEAKPFLIKKYPLLIKIDKIIKENENPKFSSILFGSYASQKAEKHSDIDICFITDDKRCMTKILDEFKEIEKLHDIEINTLIFTKKQFKDMIRSKEENVGKQIIKNHIILFNPELYWNIVFEEIKDGF